MIMTEFWHWWIILLTGISLVGCFWIITVNLKNYTHVDEGESMGHEFDGIEELNNPLPKWWTYMFYFILVWAIFYLIMYPGLGNYKGLLGWQSSNQGIVSLEESRTLSEKAKAEGLLVELDQEYKRADEVYGPIFKAMANKPLLELANDEEAHKVGQRLFLQNCALCHGSDARGSTGFPNLADNDWLYGGEAEQIKASIMHGRRAAMPAWEAALGEQGVKEVTEYVLSLSGRDNIDSELVQAGQAKFPMFCAACHGAEGKGSPIFGAPNLTDNIWLYGGSRKAVAESITKGRNGVMPAWNEVLGEDKVHVISAYIYSLSQQAK